MVVELNLRLMEEICCGVVSDQSEGSSGWDTISSRAARKRRMEMRKVKIVAGAVVGQHADPENGTITKKPRLVVYPAGTPAFPRECNNVLETCGGGDHQDGLVTKETATEREFHPVILRGAPVILSRRTSTLVVDSETFPKFGMESVCGRRRDMEDAVAIHPSFCLGEGETTTMEWHYFAVYDGHGCSHVATKCRERMHVLVKEELQSKDESTEWKKAMERSFKRMDQEAVAFNTSLVAARCRCELRSPECDAVGSAAVVVVVTPDKIIVANCGDSRAVLSRNGKPIPLSIDHKPDRPDELDRIQSAGGRVITWDCPRVEGVLAMSRAIGDHYLKPYVSCKPEVTITNRTADDDCLILASDGLWDVVSNETACGVARMCLKGKGPSAEGNMTAPAGGEADKKWDKACSDASTLLTKLALARRSCDNVSVIVIDLKKNV